MVINRKRYLDNFADVEGIIKSSLKNYNHHLRLLDKQSLAQREPEIFNFFIEFYSSLMPLSREINHESLRKKVKTSIALQKDALLMTAVAPADLYDVHRRSLKSINFINVDDSEFQILSQIVLQEVIAGLYYAYSE